MASPALAYTSDAEFTDDAPDEVTDAKLTIVEILQVPNLATKLTEQELAEISRKAIDGYELDDRSRNEWKERTKSAMDLAMLLGEEKNYPFPGAANVKYPLLTTAALQFNARAYPAIIQGDRVAKCKVNGNDTAPPQAMVGLPQANPATPSPPALGAPTQPGMPPSAPPQPGTTPQQAPDGAKAARAERVSSHLSWQLTSEMPEWEEDTDRLLLIVSIVGAVFRKVYWDPTLGRKCSRLVTADRLVVNYKSRSLEDVPRISEEMWLYPYEIEERIRDGRFIEFKYGDAKPDEDGNGEIDEDGPHKFIEQHRLLDLDGDNYPEPYIVTIHLETEKVCRIVPNFTHKSVRVTQDGKVAAIRRQDYYTKYVFMQSPDGGAYGMGLGWLLLGVNEAIDTTANEMLDAGHLANINAGFISAAAGFREKTVKLEKGVFKVVNTGGVPMNQAIMQMTYPGPSASLMSLLEFLIDQGKEVASIKDVLTGDTGGKVQQPTTVLALIEQGMKVFNAIFKRIHRSVKHELQIHARLNFEHLSAQDYNEFFDGPDQYDPQADYNLDDMNITPVSDPSVSTQMQRMAKSQVAMEIGKGNPNVDQRELTKRALEAAEVPDIEKLMPDQPQVDPKQQAFMETMQQMMVLEKSKQIEKLETSAGLDVAMADKADGGQWIAERQQYIDSLATQHGMEMDHAGLAQQAAGLGGVPGVAGSAADQAGDGSPQGAGAGTPGGTDGQPVQPAAGPAGGVAP